MGTVKTRREEVYDLIDGERGYQLRRWGVMGPDGNMVDPPKTVGEWILAMQYYITKATQDWTINNGDMQALEQVRKVAALGVGCMEQHQTLPRNERMVENLRSGPLT